MQPHQSSLAMQGFEASLPPPKHKRSTDEVFSEPQRLHKVLASCGFGSRRAMEELILAGRITVNRMPADIGQKVGPGDEVRINGEPVKIRFAEPKARVLVYHKPTGELVTRDDPEERPTVFGMLPAIKDGRWIAVGRLDYNTEGLLLFTNSGELANRLMHPRYEVEREYAVRVLGRLTDEQIETLKRGVELEDGPAKCERVEDAGGDEDASNHWYKVVVNEGRNREVRRLFEALGLTVSRLIRVRYGRVAMPPPLKRGEVMELEAQEVNALLRFAGLKPQGGSEPQQQAPVPQRQGAKPSHAHPRPDRQPGAPPNDAQPGAPGDGKAGGARKRRRGRKRGGPGAPVGEAVPAQVRHGRPSAPRRAPHGPGPGPKRERDGNLPHAQGPRRERDGNVPHGHGPKRERDGNVPHRQGPVRERDGNVPRNDGSMRERDGNVARDLHEANGNVAREMPEPNGNVEPRPGSAYRPGEGPMSSGRGAAAGPQGPVGGPGQKKRRRRGRGGGSGGGGGGGSGVKGPGSQKWVGLPRDEEEVA
ncbi:MAG: pseudouridine synthase [Betaproteobacteria bacterium]